MTPARAPLCLLLLALTQAAPAVAQMPPGAASGLSILARIAGPDGGWDYASFDAQRRRVYVAHGTAVMMIDADSGAATPAFAKGDHLHAVTPVPGTDRIVTTNSGDTTAKVLSAVDGSLIASVPTPKDPDSALYDPATGDVIVIGGDSGTINLLDPKAAKLVDTITLGTGLEFLASDGKGRLYVNEEEKNAIAVVDLAARKLVAEYPMPGCQRPTGLALVAGDRLISACGNGMAEIVAARTGRVIASLKIGGGPDAVIYDAARSVAYVPSGASGTLAVIALSGPADNTIVDTVATTRGARTGTVDPRTGRIYLPAAEYVLPTPAGQRPQPKPGTFQVLVLGK